MRKKALPQELSSEHKKLKSKWQIALRRYVLEEKPCPEYAPYFGLSIALFREWIEQQFDTSLSWENFSREWQFDHIIPTTYFDLNHREDLLLCWNFINIRIDKINARSSHRVDVLGARNYFKDMFGKSANLMCERMIQKIESIERLQLNNHPKLESFLLNHSDTIRSLQEFNEVDFEKVNQGTAIADILMEKSLLAKFAR